MGTEEEKASRVRAFASGVVKSCTATDMLGLELDAPGIRVVIHVEMCFLMRQHVQESGCAERMGLPSECIVLVPSWRTRAGETRRSEFPTSTPYRRIPIDSHMDGREDRQHCEIGEATCDLCSARSCRRAQSVERLVQGATLIEDEE